MSRLNRRAFMITHGLNDCTNKQNVNELEKNCPSNKSYLFYFNSSTYFSHAQNEVPLLGKFKSKLLSKLE